MHPSLICAVGSLPDDLPEDAGGETKHLPSAISSYVKKKDRYRLDPAVS